MGMVADDETGQPLWYRAIHRKVLIVYVVLTAISWRTRKGQNVRGDWAAYVVPVPGENHEKEAQMWRTEGVKMTEKEARALYGAVTEDFDNRRLKYRP
ncbi:hypothetical protein CMI37_30205 [Candidatus Pacearchaeota archaeon]|nr:hypothetical protein [Candidatus Pacearchaeota archaeon]|tara:strand:- start:212 stop:505 length:294 start_codon:yes stop_codon:yes gene_type:complete